MQADNSGEETKPQKEIQMIIRQFKNAEEYARGSKPLRASNKIKKVLA